MSWFTEELKYVAISCCVNAIAPSDNTYANVWGGSREKGERITVANNLRVSDISGPIRKFVIGVVYGVGYF